MKNKFNSIIANEKIRKDIFGYHPELAVNKKITRQEREFLYPIIEDTFKHRITWDGLPYGLTMDHDSCLIKFFKYAEGKRINQYVLEKTRVPLPTPEEEFIYPFSKNQIISALVYHIKKYNIDFMTIRYRSEGNQNFKSYWDKISET